MLLLFDRALLAMGNLLFVSGVALTIGPMATVKFFLRKRNRKGTAAFFGGFLLVLWGWAMVGMLLEGYGVIALFAGFLPTILIFLAPPGCPDRTEKLLRKLGLGEAKAKGAPGCRQGKKEKPKKMSSRRQSRFRPSPANPPPSGTLLHGRSPVPGTPKTESKPNQLQDKTSVW